MLRFNPIDGSLYIVKPRRQRKGPPPSAFTNTDGGKAEAGFAHERNDCSVRAWAIAKGIPYAEAHAAFKAAGRKDRDGTPGTVSVRVMGEPTERLSALYHRYGKYPTFAEWMRDPAHRAGTWVVHYTGHALCVINGVQHDNGEDLYKPRARVCSAWRIA